MPPLRQIRATYDAHTITVYQAYPAAIAQPAVRAQRFVPPFSLNRMTWIKPSFLWLMERSNWAQKSGQEHVLAVRITRAGWEDALSLGVLTHAARGVYPNPGDWQRRFEAAMVHIQWDPERSLRGAALEHESIQVGLSRRIVQRFVEAWTVSLEDITPLVRKIHRLLQEGQAAKAAALLPPERPYPLPPELGRAVDLTPSPARS